MKKTLIKSIFAGILIGIGASANIKLGGLAGAVIFTVGLITILVLKLKLFTGVIGFVKSKKDLAEAGIILIGNLIGTISILGVIDTPVSIWASKVEIDLVTLFIRAILCGILIHAAVWAYKVKNNLVVTCFAVPAFIIIGAEHSIADMAYMWCGNVFDIRTVLALFVIISGNAVGSLLLDRTALDN